MEKILQRTLALRYAMLAIIAAIFVGESWETIGSFGKSKNQFLKKCLKIPNGIGVGNVNVIGFDEIFNRRY